jgi:dynactin complex subunit
MAIDAIDDERIKKKEVEEVTNNNDVKKLKEQVEFLVNRVESMEKEMYEIRKGNTQGQY